MTITIIICSTLLVMWIAAFIALVLIRRDEQSHARNMKVFDCTWPKEMQDEWDKAVRALKSKPVPSRKPRHAAKKKGGKRGKAK
jgi:hypothetical protein